MSEGGNPAYARYVGDLRAKAAFLGGGGAANGTLPANGQLTDTTATYPKGCNIGTSLTYVSTGLYTMIYSKQMKNLLYADAIVVDAGASPTAALKAVVTKITPSTRTVTVKVYTPAGVLTDLGTSDMIIFALEFADTSVYP